MTLPFNGTKFGSCKSLSGFVTSSGNFGIKILLLMISLLISSWGTITVIFVTLNRKQFCMLFVIVLCQNLFGINWTGTTSRSNSYPPRCNTELLLIFLTMFHSMLKLGQRCGLLVVILCGHGEIRFCMTRILFCLVIWCMQFVRMSLFTGPASAFP